MKQLTIGRQSAGFLQRGHPWVRKDRFTRGLEQCRSGDVVTLVDERRKPLASALIDRDHPSICARVFHHAPHKTFQPTVAIDRAIEQRRKLVNDEATSCYRLAHGEGDFIPGLRMEVLGKWLLVFVRSTAIQPYVKAIAQYGAKRLNIPQQQVVIRQHVEDERKQASAASLLDGSPLNEAAEDQGVECGVPIILEPAARLASGIYVDQRGTREWLHQRCGGKRVLNLFAYTGLFSTSCLVHGAAHATSVDLSSSALQLADRNAALAGVSDRHRSVRQDCISFCQKDRDAYDLIICDPPTAAQGAGGWLTRRDYPKLMAAIRDRLSPGGQVLACCNTLGKTYDLKKCLEQAGLSHLDKNNGPRLASDIPQIRGFPEGRPFELMVGFVKHPCLRRCL